MKTTLLSLAVAGLLAATACTSSRNGMDQALADNRAEGDETIYALASDGCNDTVLVFITLPYNGSDPDTLFILDAMHEHQGFGQLNIGDKLAIVRHPDDSTKALRFIVVDDLIGQWSYEVMPQLRQQAGGVVMTDSIRQLLEVPREYGFVVKADNQLFTLGIQRGPQTLDEQSPVEYPQTKHYSQWAIYNGQLLLTETGRDSIGNLQRLSVDTVDFVTLTPDTLVLRFGDELRGYRKNTETQE